MLESDDTPRSLCLRVAIGFGPTPQRNRHLGTEIDKSSVDDFAMERGIVRARVGLSYDPLRLSPCSLICMKNLRLQMFGIKHL